MAMSPFRTYGLLNKVIHRSNNQRVQIFYTESADRNFAENRKLLKTCFGIFSGVLAACGSVIYMLEKSVQAIGIELHPPNYCWAFDKFLASFDHKALRRGWVVYKQVCSTCHGLRFVRFKNMVNVIFTEEETKAIAAEFEVEDGPDAEGNYFKRPGKLADMVPSPYRNEEAARAANNGAFPMDLSLIVNARHNGQNYVFSLLTSYMDPPAGIELMEGQYFNPYFPGGALSMGEMIQNESVEYDDGTPNTQSQIAKDIVEFLTWTANPEHDTRKIMALKVLVVGSVMLTATTCLYRQRWATIKSRKIYFVPKMKF